MAVTTGGSARRVAVIGGNRIPFARSNTVYSDVSNQEMLTAAIDGLVERFGLEGERVGEVVAGAVLKHSRDFNLTRESVLGSRLSPETPAIDLQQACGTGLQAAIEVANKIALGKFDVGIAGGTDTTSDAPVAVGDKLRKKLMKVNAARDTKGKILALGSIRPGDIGLEIPQNGEPRTGLSMGEHAALTALEWQVSREEQDELAAASHQHLAAAYERGFLDDQVTPFRGVERDQNLRPDSSVEKLAKLKPVFGRGEAATMTAGNSTPLTDGAAVVLLASDEWASAHGHEALAYLTDYETAAVDYVHGGEGLLMAPAYAVSRMLERNGLTLQDFDFYEIHEAFASQVLSTLKAWEDPVFCKERLGLDAPLGSIDRARLNVNGSSLAAGHPFAATGGRILNVAAKLLAEKGSGRALISICAAGGQGVVAILER
jgi:acetyl-CoA C-acetyltransferase